MSFTSGQPTSSSSSGPGLFGTSSSNSGGLFGSSTQGKTSLFGAVQTSTAPSFGASTGNPPSLFGSNPQSNSQPFNGLSGLSTSSGSPASLFTTPNKPGGLFGGSNSGTTSNTASSLFPSSGSGSTTPAATKTLNLLSNPSTTPAGAPPNNAGGVGSLFGAGGTPSSNGGATGAVGSGGAGTGGSTAFNISNTSTTRAAVGLPGSSSSISQPTSAAPNGTSLFPSKTGEAKPSTPLFGVPGSAPSSTGNAVSTSFPVKPQPATTSAAKPGASSFSFPSQASTSAPTTSAATAVTSSSLFGGISSSSGATTASAAPTTATASSATATSIAPSIAFGNSNTSSSAAIPGSTTATSSAATANLAAQTGDQNKANSSVNTSTAGPKPTPQSRLKNKSMDEIITRWATDLQKYQKEFQKQASKVAEWDKVLVGSSEQIQKLYGSTLEAERATAEVERQLTAVEHDQSEIEYWLEHYEKQVDELIANQGSAGNFAEGLQGPDAERERTFKMAEKLNDRLTEMGKDLGSMVDEINDASQGLNKGSTDTDPLSQIVKVLNGHLAQLQTIDQGTTALQAKVMAAQNVSRGIIGNNGILSNNPADDFYKSYMGRR